jgi:signal transduction histidine kinase/ActR/RegA family two-component response regulator
MDQGHDSELASLPREELVERARALQTVLRVAHAVSACRGVTELAERLVDTVTGYTRFPSVCVFRFDRQRQTFDLVAQRGFDVAQLPAPTQHLPAGNSLTGLAAKAGHSLTADDIAGDARVEPTTRTVLAESGYVSATSVPLRHDGETLGAINLLYPKGAALRDDERRLLEAIGQTVSLAMAHQIGVERERELEAQARRAQQLDSLGVLAGGLAHDFNNLLVGIVGCIDLARLDAQRAELPATAETLSEALDAADRARALVRQLLTFSRGGAPSRRPIADFGLVVRDAATFAARGTSVRCEVDIPGSIGVVEADPGQVAQVVQNLVLNACQASPEGGTVRVRVQRAGGPQSGQGRVRIEVADEGAGIAPEHLPRIFEPYYTLRDGGSGLGLSVSHSIVARHGGTLTVESTPGRGSTFTVELPASDRHIVSSLPPPSSNSAIEGRVLLMDDEPAVRRVGRAMLESLGAQVEEAEHGAAALELAVRAYGGGRPFRVAILDLTIAGGAGAFEIADHLRRVSPGIRLVLSTGYARRPAAIGAKEPGWDATLDKPYRLEDLRGALEQALEKPAAAR